MRGGSERRRLAFRSVSSIVGAYTSVAAASAAVALGDVRDGLAKETVERWRKLGPLVVLIDGTGELQELL